MLRAPWLVARAAAVGSCVLVSVAWALSEYRCFAVAATTCAARVNYRTDREFCLTSCHGIVSCSAHIVGWGGVRWDSAPLMETGRFHLRFVSSPTLGRDAGRLAGWRRLGFAMTRKSTSTSDCGFVMAGVGFTFSDQHDYTYVWQVPYWGVILFILMATGIWIMVSVKRRSVSRLRDADRCNRCDYDIRASTERCPECGNPLPQAAQHGNCLPSPARYT